MASDFDELQFNASPEEFTSKKITTKILQQIEVSPCWRVWRLSGLVLLLVPKLVSSSTKQLLGVLIDIEQF